MDTWFNQTDNWRDEFKPQPSYRNSEIYHWELGEQYRDAMICPSTFEGEWYANFVEWYGLIDDSNRSTTYATAEDAIAAAKAEIDRRNEIPEPDEEVFHWELATYYRGHLVCPSQAEGEWFGNFLDWLGMTERFDEEFGTAEAAIAAAKAKIDEEIYDWINGGPWNGIKVMRELGVIYVPGVPD